MTKPFSFNSTISDIQNRIVAASIKDVSNLELLKSEEAIREVIKSYTDRFNSAEGMLTNVAKYMATSKDLVRLKDFNDLFESLYIDLSALYNDLEAVDQVLSLNLHRNRNYYLVIKKRIRDLWKRLHLTRLNIYDLSPADESFYESFYSNVASTLVSKIRVDKKNGFLYLEPRIKKVFNNFNHIKNVSETNYPVENEDGGVVFTTSPLNDLNENYSNGTRDLLRNGLWKEQILCTDIPNITLNIGSDTKEIKRNYRGVVSVVDIEYNYPVEINRLDVDVFGEKILDIDAVLYKVKSSDEWTVATIEDNDPLNEPNPFSETKKYSVRGRAFDIISFLNMQKIKVKHLRLVFNQQNYSLLNSNSLPDRTVEQQISEDLSQRRYELVEFGSNPEEELTTPVEDTNKSMYSKIMAIVESTRDIQTMLDRINEVLVPSVNVLNTDFATTAKFDLGAWSIEPTFEEYTSLVGKFDSKPYTINDRHLLSVSVDSEQESPASTSCNWYIQINGKVIPIQENGATWRKEPLNIVDMSSYGNFKDFPGSFVLLDFPVDPNNSDLVGLFENGEYDYSFDTKIAYLNSRLLYLHDLVEPARGVFAIRYPLALYNCVSQYILSPKSGNSTDINSVINAPLGICSNRKEILQGFINTARFSSVFDTENTSSVGVPLSDIYTISMGLSTIDEARAWHGESFSTCIFISESIYNLIDTGITTTPYNNLITTFPSKLEITESDLDEYYAGTGAGQSDLRILAVQPNVAPLSTQRII